MELRTRGTTEPCAYGLQVSRGLSASYSRTLRSAITKKKTFPKDEYYEERNGGGGEIRSMDKTLSKWGVSFFFYRSVRLSAALPPTTTRFLTSLGTPNRGT